MKKQIFLYIYFILLPLLSFCTSYYFVNPIKNIGSRFGFIDKPDERKHHTNNIVRLGGVSIYLGFLISLSIIFFNKLYGIDFSFIEISFIKNALIGSTIFFLLGILDDLFRISPFIRLFIQSLTVLLISLNG